MEEEKTDEPQTKPSEMEQQSNYESEDENTRHCESNHVAIVNNEHAYSGEGAGLEHMAYSGAGVSADSSVSGDNHIGFESSVGDSEDLDRAYAITTNAQIHSFSFDMEQDSNSNMSCLQEMGTDQEEETTADADSQPTETEDSRENEQEQFDFESLSYELQVGYRILSNMMSASNRCVNKLFMYQVDDTFPETADYYKKIKEPMWMLKMKEKFENHEYKDLTEFMADFRLMIENCYRFNGPDNFVSKKAQKLETMMKQKIALLSRDLRDKISGLGPSNSEDDILATAGLRRRVRNPNASADDPSQQLLSQLRRDREMQERVDRRQKVEDRKAMEQARVQELQDWEDSALGPEIKEQIRTMWELPQIGLFVYLCMESLGLEEEVTQYQLERGLAMPRECSDFRRLMTCLLSTPNQRKSLKDFMPYHVWNAKLSKKLDYLYKVLTDKFGNETQEKGGNSFRNGDFQVVSTDTYGMEKACYVLGLDIRAFKIMGKQNPLLKKPFHQLSYLKRVWILKNYCDFCLETQPYLQKTIEDIEAVRPMDVREVLLGSDGRGYRYINFPMFTGKDIRIYKHAKHPEPSLASLDMEDWSMDTGKASASSSRCSTPVNQRNNRLAETPSTSLRARALLMAAESKEASPMRDMSRSGSEAPDTNSVTPVLQSSRCNTPDDTSATKAKQVAAKKRKRSAPFLSKRKRFKAGSKKTTGNADKSEDQEIVGDDEKDEEEGENNSVQNGTSADDKVKDKNDSVCNNEAADSSKCDSKSSKSNGSSLSPSGSKKSLASSESDTSLAVEVSSNVMDVRKDSSAASPHSKSPHIPVSSSTQTGKTGQSQKAGLSNGASPMKNENVSVIEKDGKQQVDHSLSDFSVNPEQRLNGISHISNLENSISLKDQDIKSENTSANQDSVGMLKLLKNIKKEELEASEINSSEKVDPGGKTEAVAHQSNAMCVSGNNVNNRVCSSNVSNHGDGQDVKAEDCLFSKEIEKEEQPNNGSDDSNDLKIQPNEEATVKEEGEEDGTRDFEIKMEEEEEESDDEELPELGKIELVAETMEEIRQLMNKLSNPEPVKRGKRVYPGMMKPCEEELLANVTRFHEELLKYERSLLNARVGMQVKLRKEVESYVEPKVEEVKGWDSEQSQSSKDSSDDEDSEEKTDTEAPKQPKKSKAKATTALLSSAASKLSAINGEGNDDSNDSYEPDFSSRGRLRKRRIIPNNTEDTGLRKRKNNWVNFDFLPSVKPPTTTVAPVVKQGMLPTIVQHQPGKPWPSHIVSMLTSSTSNSAIKAQLAANTSRPPGQILRLVTPGTDGTMRTLRVAGKPNVIISPQNLSNVRFISSTGIVTLPRNRVVSSSAQSSHPVIQQLLLNQTQSAALSTTTITTMAVKSSATSTGLLQKQLAGASAISKATTTPSAVKMSLVITSPTSSTIASKSSTVIAPQTAAGAVVVTQVSTSMSQGGKQVLDLGNLSVTQLQQLMKNQAIQINTGAGNPTTLLLTTGLQQLATSRVASTVTSSATASTTQIRIPITQASLQAKTATTGASSLLAVINKAQRPQTVPPQILLNNKLNPLLTISRQVSPQLIRPQGLTGQASVTQTPIRVSAVPSVVNPSVSNVVKQTGVATVVPSVGGPNPPAPSTQLSTLKTPGAASIVIQTSLQKSLPPPRIISSLSPSTSLRIATSPSSDLVVSVSSSVSSLSSSASLSPSVTLSPSQLWSGTNDSLKSRIITVPLIHLSPSKKYASNVTVKALLENRGNKKSEEDAIVSNILQTIQSITQNQGTGVSSVANGSVSGRVSAATNLVDNESGESKTDLSTNSSSASTLMPAKSNVPGTIIKTLQNQNLKNADGINVIGMSLASVAAISTAIPKSTLTILNPSTLPLSVDTTIQSVATVTTSEIILPTMNIKVPSPNTLPSVLHNKNGTTIVQSTKVPIPVASEAKTGDSVSPSATSAPISIAPGVMVQVPGSTSVRVQTASSGNMVIMPASTVATVSTIRLMNTGSVLNTSQSLKNITLKVTPQNGGSGQFVQGYMTSKGLVIPQTALLQQQQAGGNIVLANVSQSGSITQIPASQLQVQSASVMGAANQQTVLNLTGSSTGLGQPLQQQQVQKLVVAGPGSIAPSNTSSMGALNQGNPSNIKVMLVNPSAASSSQPSGSATPLAPSQPLQTNTPASELVKQIANSSQVQTGSQHQVGVNTPAISAGTNPQNAVQLLSNLGIQQQSNSNAVSNLSGAQNVVNVPSGVSPQLAAQILALQQNSQLQQQQQQPNIVLTAKSTPNQMVVQSQNKPSVVTLQLNQLGQLFSNLGGGAQLQMGGATQQQQQVASIQHQLGPRLAQPNQVLQLAVNQPSAGHTILTTPQTPQVVRVGSQLSPQLQLTNQGVAQIQPNGSIVIQQQPTILPQQTQSIIIQQPNLSQQVMGQNTVHIQSSQHLNTVHQQLSKSLSVQRPVQTLVGVKPSTSTSQPQIINPPQTQSLVLSQLQSTSSATIPQSGSQNQMQFMINSSNISQPPLTMSSATVVSSSVNKIQVGSLPGSAGVSRIIRADPALMQTNVNAPNSGLQALSSGMSLPSDSSRAVIVGSSAVNSSTLTTNKPGQMIIPNSAVGSQFLVSPVKLTQQNPQANLISPIKFVGAVQTPNSGTILGQQNSTQLVVSNQLSNSGLAGLQGQVPVKPAVIYAGQPSSVTDKKEGKIAQILLSQPISNISSTQSQVVLNNNNQITSQKFSVPQASGAVATGSKLRHDSQTLLYKIGDQYFAPASSSSGTAVQQIIPPPASVGIGGVMAGAVSAGTKSDVKLLVPPAYIEASDQILKQIPKASTQMTTLHLPSGGTTSASPANSVTGAGELVALSQGMAQILQKGTPQRSPVLKDMNTNQQAQNSVNGIRQGSPQFSFSLSGPAMISSKPPVRSVSASEGTSGLMARAPGSATKQQISECIAGTSTRPVPQIATSQASGNEKDAAARNSVEKQVATRRNTFSGSQDMSSLQKGILLQRHSSVDESTFSTEEQDEKEAALNLLTLANQHL